MNRPHCSIVIPTYEHAQLLRRTLASIVRQNPPFPWEIIVVNDGSRDNTAEVLTEFPQVRVIERPQKAYFLNPGIANNVGFRAAFGKIIIPQSDDVVHGQGEVIAQLCAALRPGTFVICGCRTAIPRDDLPPEKWPAGTDEPPYKQGWIMHSRYDARPLFFLGALWRKDLYAVGGYDERFRGPCCSDDWLGDCLVKGLKLSQVSRDDLVGYHQQHDRGRRGDQGPSWALLRQLQSRAVYHTLDAPWPLE